MTSIHYTFDLSTDIKTFFVALLILAALRVILREG
jgi:hypothetical protein